MLSAGDWAICISILVPRAESGKPNVCAGCAPREAHRGSERPLPGEISDRPTGSRRSLLAVARGSIPAHACAVNESKKNPPQVLRPAGGFRRKRAVRAPANRSARDLARLFHIQPAGGAGRTSGIPSGEVLGAESQTTLRQDLDPLHPFNPPGAELVPGDQPDGITVVGRQGPTIHLVGQEHPIGHRFFQG